MILKLKTAKGQTTSDGTPPFGDIGVTGGGGGGHIQDK